ncbi:MAG: hypothetical protein HOI23_09795 [Deltaproteobacteria bacterium]|jgi:hypothetical protein|nr:hypothetical protein [Deltaproteobacteria bacterium]MBT6434546.1 hypothetical protein [Deltaproteobacteria bacterium]MBT6489457.1 hypothetical protein [Deltaproteobacteria bacterium]
MMQAAKGLRELKTEELKKLLGHIYREELVCPFTIENLTRVGFQHRHDQLMGALRSLDATAVQAVLVCVIAERPKNTIADDDDFLF